jgi:hypothetical protein
MCGTPVGYDRDLYLFTIVHNISSCITRTKAKEWAQEHKQRKTETKESLLSHPEIGCGCAPGPDSGFESWSGPRAGPSSGYGEGHPCHGRPAHFAQCGPHPACFSLLWENGNKGQAPTERWDTHRLALK